jgi:hypothetical protein
MLKTTSSTTQQHNNYDRHYTIYLHNMAPPFNPDKKKAGVLLPPPPTVIINNPYKKQRIQNKNKAHTTNQLHTNRLIRSPLSPLRIQNAESLLSVSTNKKRRPIDPRVAWITPGKYSSTNDNTGHWNQLVVNKESINDSWSPLVIGDRKKDLPTIDSITPVITRANAEHNEENRDDEIDKAIGDDRGWQMISVFKVFASGIVCVHCDKPIGSNIETVRRHMKSAHASLLRGIPNFAKFHSSIESATNNLKGLQIPLPVDSAGSVFRLKCVHCNRSYGLRNIPIPLSNNPSTDY